MRSASTSVTASLRADGGHENCTTDPSLASIRVLADETSPSSSPGTLEAPFEPSEVAASQGWNVDADTLLPSLPSVDPSDEPDFEDLAKVMRKAWYTPLVQRHVEENMEKAELLDVWRAKATRSSGGCGDRYLCRYSSRGRRVYSLTNPFPGDISSGGSSASTTTSNSINSSPRTSSALSGAVGGGAGKCFLEFQAAGAQLLTSQFLLEDRADSLLSMVRRGTLVERAEVVLQRLVHEAVCVKHHIYSVFLRWERRRSELSFDRDEERNEMCMRGLRRLVEAAALAHVEMREFVSFCVRNARKQLLQAAEAQAAGKRARELRIAALKSVATDGVVPFEVYLLFAPSALRVDSCRPRGPRTRAAPSDTFRQSIDKPYSAAAAQGVGTIDTATAAD